MKKNYSKMTRMRVSEEAKQVISSWSEREDMTEQGVASRIYEWFGRQDEAIQRGVLGMYGQLTPNIARMILEEMANQPESAPVAGTIGKKNAPPKIVDSNAPGTHSTFSRQASKKSLSHSTLADPKRQKKSTRKK